MTARRGAAGQAPVSQTSVPCSLDGLRCWCQLACAPGCDHPLSEDQAEVSHSQPTAALAGGWSALASAHGAAVGRRSLSTALATRVPVRVQTHTQARARTYARARARVRAHTHTYTHARAHTRTHTHTHTRAQKPLSGGLERLPSPSAMVGGLPSWLSPNVATFHVARCMSAVARQIPCLLGRDKEGCHWQRHYSVVTVEHEQYFQDLRTSRDVAGVQLTAECQWASSYI